MGLRYGILSRGDRVSPRSMAADELIVAVSGRDRLLAAHAVPLRDEGWPDLVGLIEEQRIDTLVCGGIARELKQALLLSAVHVVDNVAAPVDQVLMAIESGSLRPGFGYEGSAPESTPECDRPPVAAKPAPGVGDCLDCDRRVCILGRPCPLAAQLPVLRPGPREAQVLDVVLDVGTEEERTLCRISELVYFALGMRYERLGLAFCMDLLDQTQALARLLRRFFTVHAVGCKVGGVFHDDMLGPGADATGSRHVACNPFAQARFLNDLHTDLNVIVGLCVGADVLFAEASEAPTTTLFVKDKSLANNPISAIHSEYHLDEVSRIPSPHRPRPTRETMS